MSNPESNPEAGRATARPRVLAVIPARGGSKGVPAKNLLPVGGVPLVARAVRECLAAKLVTDVVVSTGAACAFAGRSCSAPPTRQTASTSSSTTSSSGRIAAGSTGRLRARLRSLARIRARGTWMSGIVLIVRLRGGW